KNIYSILCVLCVFVVLFLYFLPAIVEPDNCLALRAVDGDIIFAWVDTVAFYAFIGFAEHLADLPHTSLGLKWRLVLPANFVIIDFQNRNQQQSEVVPGMLMVVAQEHSLIVYRRREHLFVVRHLLA